MERSGDRPSGPPLRSGLTGACPAVFPIFVPGAVAVPLGSRADAAFDVAHRVPALAGGAVVIVLAPALPRPAKAHALALQHRHRRDDSGTGR